MKILSIKTTIINKYLLISSYYIVYKKMILLSLVVIGATISITCVILGILYPSIVMRNPELIIAFLKEKYGHLDANKFQILTEYCITLKNTIRDSHFVQNIIRDVYMPAHPIRPWMAQQHPNQILLDTLGRVYYIITRTMLAAYGQINRPEQLMELMQGVDPEGYRAISFTRNTARTAIEQQEVIIKGVREIIKVENSTIRTGLYIFGGLVIIGVGITVGSVCGLIGT